MCVRMFFFLEVTVLKIRNCFRALTRFELFLWLTSITATTAAFLLSPDKDILTMAASLIGFTALIFTAKGYVLGQVLIVVFAVIYGIISFRFSYFGEMLTYLGMSAPVAVLAIISWLKHPYKKTAEVAVHRIRKGELLLILLLCAAVTVLFYFLLGALGTANLLVSTVSVATSFFAAALTFMRSPYYALGYACNDVVLIVLWVSAAVKDISSLPMVICFVMFLANDLYGFYSWLCRQRQQASAAAP